MKEHIHSRIAKLLVVLALAVVASVMFVFVGCSSECAHENTHTETVAATCTTAGHTDTVCDDCGETIKTETIDALGHKLDDGTVVAATCTSGGYTLKTCTVCGAQQQIDVTDPLPHAWGNDKVIAPTCTANGYTQQTCEACGTTRDINPTPATGHKWQEVTEPATCGAAGRTYQKCDACGAIQGMQTIPATGNHTWEETKTVPATCVTDGYTEYKCSVCGATKQEVTQVATGHQWINDKVLTEPATCTTDGYYYLECANCNERQTLDVIEATGHTFIYDAEATVITAATCTTDGSITAKCHCGEVVTYSAKDLADMEKEQFDALQIPAEVQAQYTTANGFLFAEGHNYISVNNKAGYLDKEHKYDTPSAGGHDDALYQICEDIGVVGEGEAAVDYTGSSLVCTKCDLAVETAAHTPDVTPAYDCVAKEGSTDVAWTCTVCGYDQKVVEHTFALKSQDENGKWTAEPVADSNGEIAYNCLNAQVCEVCGYTNANGPHKMPAADNKYYQANCQHGTLCETCGKDVFGGKTEHKLVKLDAGKTVNGATAAAATCTAEGLDVYYCEYCAAFEADEKYPFDVTWTTLTKQQAEDLDLGSAAEVTTALGNFYTVATEKTAHDWVASKISDNKDDPTAIYCTTDYWYIDHCADCNTTRVEKTADKLTGNRKGTGNDAKYLTNDAGWYDPHEGADKHEYVVDFDPDTYLNADGSKKEGMEQFAMPTCSTNGWFLQTCSNKDDAGHQCGLRTWVEFTLEDYAVANDLEVEELLADPAWHSDPDSMPACGHPICNDCGNNMSIHVPSFEITFEMIGVGVPEGADIDLDKFIGYNCYLTSANIARLQAYLTENINSAVYNVTWYESYADGAFDKHISDDWTSLIKDEGDDTFNKKVTVYGKVELAEGAQDTIFATGYNTTAQWINDNVSPNRTQYLDIEFYIDTNVIAIDKVEGITVALKDNEGTQVAGATCSTEAQLAAFVKSCANWGKNGSQQWIQIEEFCNKVVAKDQATANLDGVFTVWNTVEYKTCLDGYTLEITLKAGGVEFKSTVTISDTKEQIMVDGVLQINDVPAAVVEP